MTRIFVADDHPIFRRGLMALLEDVEGFELVGHAGDGHATLEALGQGNVDVLVLDLSLPVLSGVEVLRRARTLNPAPKIVVLSMYPEEQYAAWLQREGAAAYVSKHRAPETLVDVIQRVVSEAPPGIPAPAPHPTPGESLSARERQVLMRLVEGRAIVDIAAELGVGQSTVSTHVARIRAKVGVKTTSELVAHALRTGIAG